ncbi:MAG: hypothetical protein MNPFHGCM_01920 [Gemmatimonadaceae bacterium]|nr:hypothetical protein [Gemmatimonadaceae bacterium]
MAPAAPGGGWDQTARVMQQVLLSTGLAASVQVTNAPGAAGTIGLARFVNADAGNGNALLVTGLVMVSGIASNATPVTLVDVTPIARLAGEFEVIVVPAGSPYRSLADLIAAFKSDPRGVAWGGGSSGGTDEILVRLLADATGVPRNGVNYVAYSGGGQALAAVLGAHVTAAVSGLGEFAAQLESGELRALAISAPTRIATPGTPPDHGIDRPAGDIGSSIPTFREQGIDVVLMNWRGVVAPPGISIRERQALESLIERMSSSQAWKDALVRNGWTDLGLAGEPFARFIADETRRVAPLVTARDTSSRDWFELAVLTGLALSVATAIRQRVSQRRSTAPRPVTPPMNVVALLLTGAGMTVEAVLLRPAGFVLASAAMFTVTARAFGSRTLLRDAVVGILLAAAVVVAFTRGLGLSLPAGPFG